MRRNAASTIISMRVSEIIIIQIITYVKQIFYCFFFSKNLFIYKY